MIKKTLIFVIVGIFLLSSLSAMTLDNSKVYNPLAKEVLVKNSFGFGDEVAKIKLNTPLKVFVPRGYQKVAEFNLTYFLDENGWLDKMEFYDMKQNMKKINRNFDYKLKEIQKVKVNDYETICYSNLKEKGNSSQICKQKVVGSHYEDKVIWKEFNKADLQKGKTYTIGVFTNVKKGDSVEWIPTFYGVKIKEWAGWEESLNTGLVAYYKLDKTSGAVVDELGNYNGTNNGATRGVTGKINKSFDFINEGVYVNISKNFPSLDAGESITVSFWYYPKSRPSSNFRPIFNLGKGGDNPIINFLTWPSGEMGFYFETDTSDQKQSTSDGTTVPLNQWSLLTFVLDRDSNKGIRYLNGVKTGTEDDISAQTGTVSTLNSVFIKGGGVATVDEVGIWYRALNSTEIADLYNNGDGITYEQNDSGNAPDKPSLNSPADNSQFIETSPVLNVTVTDPDSHYLNVSFYQVNGSYLFTEEWTKFRGNLNNTGYTTNDAPDDITKNVMSYTTGSDVLSSPVVANGYVYVGSDDNKIYQLNATDMSLVNSYTTGSWVYSSPAIANGYVYVGSNGGKVYQLNATDLSYVNSYTTGSSIYSSPAIANGYVYVGSNDNKIYQLNATDLSYVNSYTTGDDIHSSPVVANGYVYVGSNDNKIYQLNATDMSLVNSYTTGYPVHSSPAVANGYVYVGSDDNKIYQLNATDMSLVNSYTTGNPVRSSPAIANGYVYVGSLDHKIYQLNATDLSYVNSYTTFPDYTVLGWVASSPVVANGYVYIGSIGSDDKKIYQLNATDLSYVNSYTTWDFIISSPAVANGYVYIGSLDNKIYKLGEGIPADKKLYTQTNVANNSAVTYTWEGLSPDETYYWYTEATDGNHTTQSDIWNFTIEKLIINSESYSSSTMEGNTETFTINVSINPSYQISTAKLIYDGVPYSSTFSKSGNEYFISKELDVPKVNADENKSFYWSIKLNDDTTYNSTTHNQTILNFDIDDCSVYSTKLFNLNLVDEETQKPINETTNSPNIEIDINIYTLKGTTPLIEYSTNFTDSNTGQICISNSLANSSYILDTKIVYNAVDYQTEQYNIKNFNLNSTSIPMNITLYDILKANSESFIINVKDSSFRVLRQGLIVIAREYVSEGKFKSVEIPITDSNGRAVASLSPDDTTYTIYVYKEGELIATFENIIATCQNELYGECEINLNAYSSITTPQDYTTLDNVNYNLYYDENTRNIEVLFSTINGGTAHMNLTTVVFDNFLNNTICSDALTSSAGSLNCNIPSMYNNETFLVTLSKDGDIIYQAYLSLKPNAEDFFGKDALLFVLIIMMTIPLMMITSPVGMVIGVLLGLIFSSLLIFTDTGILSISTSIIWVVVAGLVIIWKITQGGRST